MFDDGRKWKNTPEGQNLVSRIQMAQMSIEAQKNEEIDIKSDEDEVVSEQVWITMAAQEVVEELESCHFEEQICPRLKDLEKAMQLTEDESEVQCI